MIKYIGDLDLLESKYGFDDYRFRSVGVGNNAIHILSNGQVTYGTYMTLDIYKVNKKYILDLIKDGLIEDMSANKNNILPEEEE